MMDAASSGALVNKTPYKVRELISIVVANLQQFGFQQEISRRMNEVEDFLDPLKRDMNLTRILTILDGGITRIWVMGKDNKFSKINYHTNATVIFKTSY
ncbi:hypothetical protein ES332_A02G065300v1 [Gossypium tomentosum]|uniref:Uncharacterized protein n=1 Tax=Gossypium tomentosum TaxID=34277 RepID=A0A5D2RGJ1_GOSTO|nr:hypothetical protein ES332_A02G065300v1 [Gossypium tomentosum]